MAEAARKIRYSSYDSMAYAPAFETGFGFPDEGVVVQPRVLPREHAVARPKVELRPAGQVSIFAVLGFLAVAAFAVLVLMSYVKLNAISDEVVNLRSEYTQLKNEESRLLAQYELAFDLKSIEAAVTADGRMVKPQNSQVYYMDLSGNDSVEIFEQETPTTALNDTFEVLLAKAGEFIP